MPSQAAKHLPSFSQLAWNIYLHTPPSSASAIPADHPHLIVLLTWGSAPIGALSKYANHYATMYPSSRILVLTTYFYEFFIHRFPAVFHPTMAPAVSVVREVANQSRPGGNGNGKSRILAHAFSNGGCFKLVRLSHAYREATGGDSLPLDSVVFDSSPGIGRFWHSLRAFVYVLPRQPVLFQIGYCMVFVYLVFWRLLSRLRPGGGRWTRGIYDELNDGKVLGKTPRLYLYSRGDDLIDCDDIEDHARQAKKPAGPAVKNEFRNSGHVAHMREYPDEYWKVVSGFWQKYGIDKETK